MAHLSDHASAYVEPESWIFQVRSSYGATWNRPPRAAKVRAIVLFDLKAVVRACATPTDRASLSSGSRYIYDMYYEKEAITKQLYDWLLKNGYADATLIAKWKKQGYEKVGPVLD